MASDHFQFDSTNLEWETWTGSIPSGAVGIYNEYEKRYDYVAKSGREAGFYCPSLDQYCHYAYGGYEYKVRSFEILVNKGNFELLEWKPGANGLVPDNAVKTIPGLDTYVGKNYYGLGKVHVSYGAFFYPWGGRQYSYKEYEVLTFSREVIKDTILDVKYKFDGVQTIQHPPEILCKTNVENRDDRAVKQTTQLSEAITESNSWSINTNLTISTNTTITAGVPDLASMTVGVSVEGSFGTNKESTYTKSITESVSVEHEVPPKHSCTLRMESRMFSADIPFTAQLQRTYKKGTTIRATVVGTYKGVQVADVRAVVEPCVPLK